MAAISGGRANDERVKCLRIFADGNGETHMEDIDITLQPRKLFKDNPPLRFSDNLPASWYNICYVPTGMGEVDWHNPPQRLLVLWLWRPVGLFHRIDPSNTSIRMNSTSCLHEQHPQVSITALGDRTQNGAPTG